MRLSGSRTFQTEKSASTMFLRRNCAWYLQETTRRQYDWNKVSKREISR